MSRRGLGLAVLALLFCLPRGAAGATLTFVPPDPDFNDFDHTMMYAWSIQGLNTIIGSENITGASIKISNISNWDTGPNKLFMHLLDSILAPASLGSGVTALAAEGAAPWTAYEAGTVTKVNGTTTVSPLTSTIYQFQDEAASTTGYIKDDFAKDTDNSPSSYMPDAQKFLGTGTVTTGNTPLGDAYATTTYDANSVWGYNPAYTVAEGWAVSTGNNNYSFSTTPVNYTYNFSAGQLTSLRNYIANGGDIAFGLDPDCHLFNDGFQFIITTSAAGSPVPEPASLTLLGTALAGLAGLGRLRNRKKKQTTPVV